MIALQPLLQTLRTGYKPVERDNFRSGTLLLRVTAKHRRHHVGLFLESPQREISRTRASSTCGICWDHSSVPAR